MSFPHTGSLGTLYLQLHEQGLVLFQVAYTPSSLIRSLNGADIIRPATESAGNLHFLATKLAWLLLSSAVELIYALMIAIGKHEFAAALDTDKSAGLVVHPCLLMLRIQFIK